MGDEGRPVAIDETRSGSPAEAYSKAIELEPRNTRKACSAQFHLEAGALEKAETDLKALRKYEPNNVMGRYLEAYVDFKRSKFAEADTKLQDVLRSSRNSCRLICSAARSNLH